jgi:hypothetical protein
MTHVDRIGDADSSPPFPSALVIWIDKGSAFKIHLAPAIEALRQIVTVETFIDTDSALQAMSAAVSSCQTGKEGARRQRVACVITNMCRTHPQSGLHLLQKMKSVFPTNVLNNEFSSFPPTIVYSASTAQNPSLIEECKAAGAMLVLANNANAVRRIITETIFPSVSLNFCISPLFEQRDKLSKIPSEYHALFSTHCLNPLQDIYGGQLDADQAQQLTVLKWRLLYDVLLNDILKAFASHCTSEKHYISGGLAINYWLKSHGFPPLLTCDCDYRFKNKDNVKAYADQMKSVLEKHTPTVRVNMSYLGLNCSDPKVSEDSYGCRVYYPLRYYNASAATAASSHYDLMWKVFDVSHNWHGDPLDIVKEGDVCYLGEKEIVKELAVDYGSHKRKRSQLRLKFVNFVRQSK